MAFRRRKRTPRTGLGKNPQGPLLLAPPELTRKQNRQLKEILAAELRRIRAEGGDRVPHLHRFRFQLVPLCWLAAACAGLAVHAAHPVHGVIATALAAALAMVVTVLGTRHRKPFARQYNQGMAAWCGCWAVILAVMGLSWWGSIGAGTALAGWAGASAFWVERYRWKGPAAKTAAERGAEVTWRELCEVQKWSAALGPPKAIPGGRRWQVNCVGAKTPISLIVGKPDQVAAAYDSSIAQAWVEPREDGVKSRGWLTILERNTLETIRPWDGIGIDPASGLAVVGRFPEGGNVRECYFVRGVGGGTRHSIVSGADGSGKTGDLDMGMCISIASGLIAPVILDPQMGQALPAWQETVPYACGIEDCMAYLRGLMAAMMARSEYLAGLTWIHPRTGRRRKGMGFFDPDIMIVDPVTGQTRPLGLPYIEVIIDEAPILLAVKGAPAIITDMAKLGRKVGFRLKLAAQVPSLKELKAAELRSILVGGNTFGLRAGDKVSGGFMNIPARLNEIPKFFPNGQLTRGLGYADTIDGRPTVPMRLDFIEEERLYDFAETCRPRGFDPLTAERVAHSVDMNAARVASLARSAGDAATRELQVLAALTGPMPMGQLVVGCDGLKPSEVGETVAALEKAGRVRRDDGVIVPV